MRPTLNPFVVGVKGYGRVLSMLRGRCLSILIFHRVLPARDPLLPGEPDAAAFEARMRWIASAFRVIPLVEAGRRLRDGSLPPNAACITFDDGYADNLTIAAPILASLRLPATFFIATGFLDGGRMWNDTVIESVRIAPGVRLDLTALGLDTWACGSDAERVATIDALLGRLKYRHPLERQAQVDRIADLVGLPQRSDLMMSSQQVRELRRHGMSIGGHTVSHPILASLPVDEAVREIDAGRRVLEDILKERVKVFAYPNGKPERDYDATHVRVVRELGFDLAVSTAWGVSDRRTDIFQLPRFTPWDASTDRFGLRLAQNLTRKAELL